MALKKRKRSAATEDTPAQSGKTATIDTRKSASAIQSQLDDRMAPDEKKREDVYRLEKITLAKIVPDPDNERTWYVNQGTIAILSKAFQSVWESGTKSADLPADVLQTTLDQIARYADAIKSNLPPEADVLRTVRGIWDFAVHLKTEPLLQPFGVTSIPGGKYQVVFGTRRYLASYVAHGDTHDIECSKFVGEPELPATKRFVENSQREDLPLQAKVADFKKAVAEVRRVADHKVSNVEISNKLGVGRNLVQKLEKISTSPDVNLLIGTGQIRSVEFAYKMSVLETSDKSLFKAACHRIAEKGEPSGDFNSFKSTLDVATPKKPARKTAGRPAKIKIPAVAEPRVIQRLFAADVLEQPQWQAVDWEDSSKSNIDRIEKLIKKTLEGLVKDMASSA